MTTKGQFKFDEFSLILIGAIIFLGMVAISLTTPSEFPPKVAPTSIKLDLDPGSYQQFNINITGKVSGVNITASGEIADWIYLYETDLGALKERKIYPVTISVPGIATTGTHTGKIVVSAKEGKAEVDVVVVVSPVKRLNAKTLPIGDFKVSYSAGTDVLDSAGNTFVSKSYLYEKPLSLVGVVEDAKLPIIDGAYVRFVVEDTNNYGSVIVTQNGRKVFDEVVGPGEVIVPLNVSDVRKSNTVTIRADNPGLFFWAENVYSIRDVELSASYNGPVAKVYNFTLLPAEYTKFDHFQLTYGVRSATPNLPPLRIELNGQTIYLDAPSTAGGNLQISRDVFGGIIGLKEKNSMRFSFDQGASYEVTGAILTVFNRATS